MLSFIDTETWDKSFYLESGVDPTVTAVLTLKIRKIEEKQTLSNPGWKLFILVFRNLKMSRIHKSIYSKSSSHTLHYKTMLKMQSVSYFPSVLQCRCIQTQRWIFEFRVKSSFSFNLWSVFQNRVKPYKNMFSENYS